MMTFLTALGSIASIAGIGYGLFKFSVWKLQKTPARVDADAAAEIEKQKQKAKDTGRPV